MIRKLIINLNWNWLGIVTDMAVAFLVCPVLVRDLGATTYGAWVLLGSLTGYFGLLDLGVRGAVGRQVALYREKGDRRAVHETINTGLAFLLVIASVLLFVVLLLGDWLAVYLESDLPVGTENDFRCALLLCGFNLAVMLLGNALDGVFLGYQRFDLLNLIRIPTLAVRGIGSVLVVAGGMGLTGLAGVVLSTTLLSAAAKLLLVVRYTRFGFTYLSLDRLNQLASFGSWNSLRSIAGMLPAKLSPVLVGTITGLSVVAPLSIAGRLINAAHALVVAAAGVLTPMATTLHARGSRQATRQMFLRGGQYCMMLSVMLATLFVLLGRPLLLNWVGPEMLDAYPILATLAVFRVFGMSQVVARSIITAQAKHRILAISSLAQSALVLTVGLAALYGWGIMQFVLITSIVEACGEGLLSGWYGCRLLKIRPTRYVSALAAAGAVAALPSCGLAWVAGHLNVTTWLPLVALATGYVAVSAATAVLYLERRKLVHTFGNWRESNAVSH